MGLTRPKLAQVTTTTASFDDAIIVLNNNASNSDNNTVDIGIVFERGGDLNSVLLWDESSDRFILANSTEQGATQGDVTISGYADLQVNNLIAEGTITMKGNVLVGDSSADTITFNGEYTFPTVDGSSHQTLATDGAGNLSWVYRVEFFAQSAAPVYSDGVRDGDLWLDTDDGTLYIATVTGTTVQWFGV